MLLDREPDRNRAGPEATFAALWSEAPCPLDEVRGGVVGDRRVVARLLRKVAGRKNSVRKRSNPRLRQHLSRPHLEEES